MMYSLAEFFNIPVKDTNRFYISTYIRNFLKLNTPIRTGKEADKIINFAYKKFILKKEVKTKKQKIKYLENKKFYESNEWRSLRYEAFKKYGRKCMVCGATVENGAILHVDHIKPRSLYPELELILENLQILCKDCNLGKSNKDSIDWR